MKATLVFVALIALVAADAVSLTGANFDELTAGKAAFVKFQAPWWGHCKSMKDAWNQLGTEFATSATALIGDVDCTVEKDLCSRFGVRGYPTIKTISGASEEDYSGGRDYAALKAHADNNLGPSCAPDALELCDDAQKATIAEGVAMGAEKLAEVIAEKTEEIAAAEKYATDEIQKLQDAYRKLTEEKEAKIAEISKPLKLWKAIKDFDGAKEEL